MTSLQPQDAHARTVLVIEDDEDTRQFVEDLLIMAGYAVLGAASGQAALTQVVAHPIDVILLDRRLPDADGIELCVRLRGQVDGAVPIILVTADRSPGLETAARTAGATDFLLKPYLPADLLGRLPPPPEHPSDLCVHSRKLRRRRQEATLQDPARHPGRGTVVWRRDGWTPDVAEALE